MLIRAETITAGRYRWCFIPPCSSTQSHCAPTGTYCLFSRQVNILRLFIIMLWSFRSIVKKLPQTKRMAASCYTDWRVTVLHPKSDTMGCVSWSIPDISQSDHSDCRSVSCEKSVMLCSRIILEHVSIPDMHQISTHPCASITFWFENYMSLYLSFIHTSAAS